MEVPQILPEGSDLSTNLETSSENGRAAISTTPGERTIAQQPQDRIRHLQDATLSFLANASNETLGACAVGLCASTYFVLGRVGLVLIGAVGGIVLHATWEGQTGSQGKNVPTEKERRRKELGIEVVKHVLDWRDSRHDTEDKKQDADSVVRASSLKSQDFSEFQPEVAEALTGFVDATIRDYVKWWYTPILPHEQSFPLACRQTLTAFILSFSTHVSHKRTADVFLDFVANSASIIIVFLNELAIALKASQRQDADDAIRTYLKHQPDSNLANVLSTEQQERKLGLVADDILQNYLDSKAFGFLPAKTFLREILAGLILKAVITTCSQPEWINGWIVYLLEDGEPELMNVIDAGMGDLNAKVVESETSEENASKKAGHHRRVSRAEEAMQEALREAHRLNEMIAEDDARKKHGTTAIEGEDNASSTTTEGGLATPNSSDSGQNRGGTRSMETSMIFDSEGNTIPASAVSTPSKEPTGFTSFDQLGNSVPTALQPNYNPQDLSDVIIQTQLTLHNASITILDMGEGNERSVLRQKPTGEYLLQIEPASSRFPGWMISRRYLDFENLHETIRRIAIISGVPEFAQQHAVLPTWKSQTRGAMIQKLEAYLKDAMKYEPLAESESMKKFLEKETGLSKAPASGKNVLVQGSAALENVGKNFINVLGQGGKGIAGGGKAVFGGVQGVFGAVATGVGGPKKYSASPRIGQTTSRSNTITSPSLPSGRDSPKRSTDILDSEKDPARPSAPYRLSSENGRSSLSSSRDRSSTRQSQDDLFLPPPPSEMSDDYNPLPQNKDEILPQTENSHEAVPRPTTPSSMYQVHDQDSLPSHKTPKSSPKKSSQGLPITEEETRISIELMFAIITELYGLSSAWTIRLSLLSAAKTFLLRPNNPQLESIRLLIQDSVIDANFSNSGIAKHITKLRENTLPTEEEQAKWPKEMTPIEKENLRIKARKLLVERGMPQALTSVMGAAASGEALGRVFDCLQVEEVARGLIFAVLLQAVRAATQ